jgi:hypothetical protein
MININPSHTHNISASPEETTLKRKGEIATTLLRRHLMEIVFFEDFINVTKMDEHAKEIMIHKLTRMKETYIDAMNKFDAFKSGTLVDPLHSHPLIPFWTSPMGKGAFPPPMYTIDTEGSHSHIDNPCGEIIIDSLGALPSSVKPLTK